MREKSVRTLRGGAGFGAPIHAVRSLRIALSGYNPEDTANVEGFVRGYGLSFDIEPPEENKARKPHPIVGQKTGLHLSPDGPHETNHSPNCRAMFGGLKTCDKLAGVIRLSRITARRSSCVL